MDLAGNWATRPHQDWQDRGPGPDVVDYLGLPLNAEGRAKALSYTASALSLPERQCLYYSPPYLVIGPFPIKMWEEGDPVTGNTLVWKIGGIVDRAVLTIWMDGRPHPPEHAPHSFSGFNTGVWEGDVLTTYTTHFKAGSHVDDPVYFEEPEVISRTWELDPTTDIRPTPAPCSPEAEVPRLDGDGKVPHLLPGKNPFVNEVTTFYHIPQEAVLGGAETLYPEYRKKLKAAYVPPGNACAIAADGKITPRRPSSGIASAGRFPRPRNRNAGRLPRRSNRLAPAKVSRGVSTRHAGVRAPLIRQHTPGQPFQNRGGRISRIGQTAA